MPIARYLTLAEVRAHGYPFSDSSVYSDDEINEAIDIASGEIEQFTGNWFTSIERSGTAAVELDGNGGNFLPLPFPIIQIDSITLIYAARYGADPVYSVDTSEVLVYNRHLTQGLQNPDDRRNPGLSIEAFLAYPKEDLNIWPEGDKNIKIEGTFGWTELASNAGVGQTAADSQIPLSEGVTPYKIKRACKLLVRRHIPKISDYHGLVSTMQPIGGIAEMKSRDQSVKFNKPGGAQASMGLVGGSTGDPDVDRMLLAFRRIPRMAWADNSPARGSGWA
jgi:hypothetical protein